MRLIVCNEASASQQCKPPYPPCFKAATIMKRRSGDVIGVFYGYDTCPSIGYHVERTCRAHADLQNAVCEPTELSAWSECPMEPDPERIRFEFVRDPQENKI